MAYKPMFLYEIKTDSGIAFVRAESEQEARDWAVKPLREGGGGFSTQNVALGSRRATHQVSGNLDGAGIYSVYSENDPTYQHQLKGQGRRIGTINTRGDKQLQDQIMRDILGHTHSSAGNTQIPAEWEWWLREYTGGLLVQTPITPGGPDPLPGGPIDNIIDTDATTLSTMERTAGVDDPSFVDPIQGFLAGLGFGVGQYGGPPTGSANFLNRQGGLGAATFKAQNVADYFGNIPEVRDRWIDAAGGDIGAVRPADVTGPATPYQFGQHLGGGVGASWAPTAALGGMGQAALGNLADLAGMGQVGAVSDEDPFRSFVNPLTNIELDAHKRDIANLLTASLQGAGMSPMFAPQVYGADIDRLWTEYAGRNPELVSGYPRNQDQNFLNFAAGKFGLNRFFPTG